MPPPALPMVWDDSAGPSLFTPPVEPVVDVPAPNPALAESQSPPPLGANPLAAALVNWPPESALPTDCDESAGPLVFTVPFVPEPEAADPATDPDALASQRTPPDGAPPEPVVGAGREEVPDEPGVGLEQARGMPLEESVPVPRRVVAGAAALHDSGPTPASIARGSRRSISASEAASACLCARGEGRFVVFRRFTRSLLGGPLGKGLTTLLGFTVGKTFMPVKESVREALSTGNVEAVPQKTRIDHAGATRVDQRPGCGPRATRGR